MRFKVLRASDYLSPEKPPVEGAVQDGDDWWVEVTDLDALLALRDREGNLILYAGPELWVYDDRIE